LTGQADSFVNGNFTGATFNGNKIYVTNRSTPLEFPQDKQAVWTDPHIQIPGSNTSMHDEIRQKLGIHSIVKQ
jgi:hypothetical protein